MFSIKSSRNSSSSSGKDQNERDDQSSSASWRRGAEERCSSSNGGGRHESIAKPQSDSGDDQTQRGQEKKLEIESEVDMERSMFPFVTRESLERRRREEDLVGLTWPTRLTIILVGTSILFSAFFGLEFLMTKLVANYIASATSGTAVASRGAVLTTIIDPDPIVNGQLMVGQRLQLPAASHCDSTTGQRPHKPADDNNRIDWRLQFADKSQQQQQQQQQSGTCTECQCSTGQRGGSEQKKPVATVAKRRRENVIIGHGERRAKDRARPPPPIGGGASPFGVTSSKLGIDLDLIYEQELGLSESGMHFEKVPIKQTGGGGDSEQQQRQQERQKQQRPKPELLVQPELKLNQLLGAYHLAMPFNPDIWLLTEPDNQLHLLTGNLFECRHKLSLLVDSIERALDVTSLDGQSPLPPLQRVGQQHYNLMKLLDSFGRPESGTLTGHPFWLGSYLGCNKFGASSSGASSFEGGGHNTLIELQDGTHLETRYCVAKVAFKSWLDETTSSEPIVLTSSIKMGLCLPRQCDSLELFRHQQRRAQVGGGGGGGGSSGSAKTNETIESIKQLAKRLIEFNLNEQIYPSDQFQLVDIFCLPANEIRRLGPIAHLLLLAIFTWLALMLVCTCLRHKQCASSPSFAPNRLLETIRTKLPFVDDNLLDIMSIDTNIERFLAPTRASGQSSDEKAAATGLQVVNLGVLDSIKHLGCLGVILAHVLLTYLTLGTAYNHTIETIGRDMRTMMLLSLNNIVDTFFVISGLLIAYLTFKNMKKDQNETRQRPAAKCEGEGAKSKLQEQVASYAKLVAKRYLRMAPLYFLVYVFAKTISVHLGEGPLWDYATNGESLRGLCRRESWLWPALFASDFKPITQHCVPPAWSVAVDMQFALILPLFVFGLSSVSRRVRQLTYCVSISLVLLSTALSLAAYQSLLDYVSQRDFAKLRLPVFTVLIRHAAHAYSQPQNRMGPILVGLLGGHLLHEYEQRQKRFRAETNKSDKPNKRQPPAWPAWMRGVYFKLAVLVCVLSILAPCLVQLRERTRHRVAAGLAQDGSGGGQQLNLQLSLYDTLLSSLLRLDNSIHFDCYLALGGFVLIKPVWSLCNCIVFLRLCTDLNTSLVARLMSLNYWQIVSKLNYAILLIHFELIAYEAMSRLTNEQPVTWTYLLCKFAFAYMLSLLIAAPLCILFEQPVQRLINRFVWHGRQVADKHEPDVNEQQVAAPAKSMDNEYICDENNRLRQQLRDMQAESRLADSINNGNRNRSNS